jgi:rhodanese-related sulfurtransferase
MRSRSRFRSRAAAALALSAALLLGACSSGDDTAGTTTDVSVTQAIDIVAQEDMNILDVRTPAEFAAGHLEGAVNIDVQSPSFDAAVSQLPKDEEWFVYCRSGNRSGVATDRMADLGFTRMYDLQGGINDWTAAGQPVVTD